MLIVSIVLITGKTVHLCLFSERQKNKCVLNVQRKKKPSPTYKFSVLWNTASFQFQFDKPLVNF